ncbi:hypothetical protein KP509_36G035800 [Ceratopteris richardii]|uniref:Tf2-1-like SH3-like domain-containing protein n=1 Tax=Ceratopteris richardii TaxID=49495 RepID=A0A8T2QC70_CERRI|nr:hypothetical protein KP509_36G035800 [Ceratopteris richardii]
MSPFEVATGKSVITPMALMSDEVLVAADRECGNFLRDWQSKLRQAKEALIKSKERMVRIANQNRTEAPDYQVGDLVLVNAKNIILPRNFTPKFNHRYYGPYRISHRFNQVTYQLALPPEIHIHNSFHVSLLKRFRLDTRFGRQVTLVEDPIEQR